LLLAATCRDSEVSEMLGQALGELARLEAERLALSGVTEDATGHLMAIVSGRRAHDDVVRAVHARTNGNPFFVTEIARLQTSDPWAVPANVRDAVSRRVALLPDWRARFSSSRQSPGASSTFAC
jgi:hypothetical protein